MSWNRKYHFVLLFGDNNGSDAPWDTTTWNEHVCPNIDVILRQSPHYKKTGVGSWQYVPKPNTSYYMPLKLGRLNWNQASHDKWTLTHHIPSRRFHHMDIWTPSRGSCEKLDASPDVYFSLNNETDSRNLSAPEFEWIAVFAVATDFLPSVKQEAIRLAQAMQAKKAVYMQGGWQQEIKNEHWQFFNSIQDTFTFTIYQAASESLHDIPFDDIQFEPLWEVLPL